MSGKGRQSLSQQLGTNLWVPRQKAEGDFRAENSEGGWESQNDQDEYQGGYCCVEGVRDGMGGRILQTGLRSKAQRRIKIWFCVHNVINT